MSIVAAGNAVQEDVVGVAGAGRLQSLDVFRGVTIAGMLIVNNPGSWSHIYLPLRHAAWHGWTPTDLIFPFFLFIVGVALTFSFDSQRRAGASDARLLRRAARRALIIFGLGLILHAFPNYLDLSNLRIPGVLQRIALAYLIAVPAVLWLGLRGRVVFTSALLVGYWALLTLVPVPGGFAGVLEPGADLGAYIDRAVFSENHLWIWSRTWDPEGLLSTLPAVGTVMLGVFAGDWLRTTRDPLEKTVGLFVVGSVLIVVGLAWGAVFPINKNLWTSSYVLFTGGLAAHFLAMCYWMVDIMKWRRWATPFVMFGVNAIAAFFLSSLFARLITIVRVPAPDGSATALKTMIYAAVFEPLLAPRAASLAFAIAYTLLWLGVMAVLYRRRIFIKV